MEGQSQRCRSSLVVLFALWMMATFTAVTLESFQCQDANGNPVDWYAVYKAPKLHSPKGLRFYEGLAYLYLDVHNPQWSLADNAINDTDTAVHKTLQQIYSSKTNSMMYLMYNDEPPSVPANRGGHTKGVLAFNDKQGFWLIHSCPKYPPRRTSGYSWKSVNYGQNLLCITFPYKQLGDIALQLLYNEPHVYDYNLPSQFANDFPVLSSVIKGKRPSGPPWYKVIQLKSSAGQSFTSFAKGGEFGADLYDALVAPTLASDLLVETWLRTSGTELDSNCTARFKVFRVNSISLPGQLNFSETKDHSKWAVTVSQGNQNRTNSSPWVCIGDINRMKSQFHRGGGTVCLQNLSVWKAYSGSVATFEKCL